MKIVDLSDEHKPLYFACLEDWSEEIKEAGDHKARWYEKMKERGLRVKLALDDRGEVGGMIQYVPIELSPGAEGKDLYFILCIWVHGHKKGRGNFQKRGMGKALLQAAEEDARGLGAKGIVAWGMALPVFMRASWFKKHGYRTVDKMRMQHLLWKPFAEEARPPRWIRVNKVPETTPGRVTVTALLHGWCPGMNMTLERARRAASEFGDRVAFRAIDAFDRDVILEWGTSDALFIDRKEVRTGPPPSYKKIKSKIAKRVNKLGRS
jgi:GNAT superfamily N-acetyltransferase